MPWCKMAFATRNPKTPPISALRAESSRENSKAAGYGAWKMSRIFENVNDPPAVRSAPTRSSPVGISKKMLI